MLTAFTAGLLLITISELGDKTFFIAVILSMQHSRKIVFAGVTAALAAMTVLSVIFGQILSVLTQGSKIYVHYAEIVLFIAFGLKLLYDGWKMPAKADEEVIDEAKEAVAKAELDSKQKSTW
ncbi:MAG: TMEM165/GDT1 family protein, partial [Sphaerospermopsis kisseleviana]